GRRAEQDGVDRRLAVAGHLGDQLQGLLAGDELAEDRVLEVEEAGRAGGDEELRAGRVVAGVGHGELALAGEGELLDELVREREARLVDLPRPGAGDRPALDDVV